MRICSISLWIFISFFLITHAYGQGIQSRPNVVRGTATAQHNFNSEPARKSDYRGHGGIAVGDFFLPQTSVEWGITIVGGFTFTTFLLSDQEVRFMSLHTDKWGSRNGAYFSRYDKIEHFGLAAAGHSFLIGLDRSNLVRSTAFRRIKLSLLLITWWEVKDSVVPSERYGSIGGEGFSSKDWLAGVAAVGGTELLNFLLGKAFGLK